MVKLAILLLLPASALSYYTQLSCVKTVVERLSFSEFNIDKLFTQTLTKFYCINAFNVGGCLATCLTFRPLLTIDP